MDIDDLLDRGADAKRRRDEGDAQYKAVVKALEGLDGVGMLDKPQKTALSKLRGRTRRRGRPPGRRAPANNSD